MRLRLPRPATLGPLLALAVACAFFGAESDRFWTGDNLSLVLQQVMVVGVIGEGVDPALRDLPPSGAAQVDEPLAPADDRSSVCMATAPRFGILTQDAGRSSVRRR